MVCYESFWKTKDILIVSELDTFKGNVGGGQTKNDYSNSFNIQYNGNKGLT